MRERNRLSLEIGRPWRGLSNAVVLLLCFGCAPAASRPASRDEISRPSATAPAECRDQLRAVVRSDLSHKSPQSSPPPGGWTLDAIERAWSADPNGYGYAALVLALPNPTEGIPLLARMLSHPNGLSRIEAASSLAVLGDRSGIERLRELGTQLPLTTSQFEFFYARASLVLLDEPIPANLEGKRSVFTEREQLIDECHTQR